MTHSLHIASRGLFAATLALAASTSSQAAFVSLSGSIVFHNDVAQVDFTLANPASNLKIWTDSWRGGINFDPIAALWRRTGADYTLVAEVDDDDSIAPGQGFYDTGFNLASLAAGSYRVTVAAAFNGARGSLLSQGFLYGNETPILLTQWNQPSYDPNANDQKGGFWRLNLSDVTQAGVVPEPATWMLVGLLLPLLAAKRGRKAQATQA
jgi:hypothetical protein